MFLWNFFLRCGTMILHLAISLYFIYLSGCSFPLIFVDFCIYELQLITNSLRILFYFENRLPDAAPRSSYGQLTKQLWASLGQTDETSQEEGLFLRFILHRGNRLPLSPTVSGKCSSRPAAFGE